MKKIYIKKNNMSIAKEIFNSNKFIVFDPPINITEPVYIMGIDQYEEDRNNYCLMKKFNGTSEIILQKTIKNKDDFMVEVENIAKYFNAEKLY